MIQTQGTTYLRTNHLMAQKVDVGIVFLDMLSEADGVAYMQGAGVPAHVIERIAHDRQRRRLHGSAFRDSAAASQDCACKRRAASSD